MSKKCYSHSNSQREYSILRETLSCQTHQCPIAQDHPHFFSLSYQVIILFDFDNVNKEEDDSRVHSIDDKIDGAVLESLNNNHCHSHNVSSKVQIE